MTSVRLAAAAMATRFELVLHGTDESRLRAAGEEAIQEIHRLEAALSVHRPDSQVAELNRDAANRPVRVTPELFTLLRHADLLSRATQGAFDISVAPLLRVWGLMHGKGRVPAEEEVAAARARIGSSLIQLNDADQTVEFARPGVTIDLGSIGKGYALDRAAELLREAGVANALIHGGTSSAIALGRPPDCDAWRIAIDPPPRHGALESSRPLAVVELEDESLSVSAVWGKGFEAGGQFFGHVIDPRLGTPVQGALLAAMILPSAAESDALSTALLVRGAEMVEILRSGNAPARCLVVESVGDHPGYRVAAIGICASVV